MAASTDTLFHGSPTEISDFLNPFESKLLAGEKVVFATTERWIALICIARLCNEEVEFGFINRLPYVQLKTPWAKNKLLQSGGYIYTVSDNGFREDLRVGLVQHEFINYNRVAIVNSEKIYSVYYELEKENIAIICDF